VTLVVPGTAGQEVEVKLKDRLQVTAAIRNAIKSLPGVAAVETL
jgi:hypothetical protein